MSFTILSHDITSHHTTMASCHMGSQDMTHITSRFIASYVTSCHVASCLETAWRLESICCISSWLTEPLRVGLAIACALPALLTHLDPSSPHTHPWLPNCLVVHASGACLWLPGVRGEASPPVWPARGLPHPHRPHLATRAQADPLPHLCPALLLLIQLLLLRLLSSQC